MKKGGFHKRRKRPGWREPRYILPDEVEALREEIARDHRNLSARRVG